MKKIYLLFMIPFALISFTLESVAQLSFTKHSIASPTAPLDVCTSDLNQDGFMDILVVSRGNGGSVLWYKNNGSQGFERKLLASGFDNPRSVRAGDIDLDGDIDVIAVAWEGDKITWWENDGAEGFLAHDVVTGWVGPHTVELCDLDKDGDVDILCCQFDNSENMSEVAWWENDGSQNWTKHVVSSRFQQSTFIYGADMDNDGDNDLIACGELNGEIYLWENDGNENWTEHIVDNHIPKIHTILPRDFDKDGDLDILAHACVSGLQAWYRNNGNGSFEKVGMENLGGAIWLDCADFDMDGDYDMMATGMGEHNLVCYENNGRDDLSRIDIEGGLESGFALNIADLDGDGDEDVVAIGLNSNTLAWWENTNSKICFFKAAKWIDNSSGDNVMFAANEDEGSIVRIEADGRQHCIRNSFPICTGLVYSDGFLWVAVGTSIYKLNPETGATVSSFRLPAQFLQGLTTDGSGKLYSTDPYSGIVFKSDCQSGQTMNLITGLDYPQSIKYDPLIQKLILMDGESFVTIKCIDPATGTLSNETATQILPGGDIAADGQGNHYISSPEEGVIYAAVGDFQNAVYAFSEGHSSPTGMVYFPEDKLLGMLSPVLDSLIIIPATATGVGDIGLMDKNNIRIYPNPVEDVLHVEMPFIWNDVRCRISDIKGSVSEVKRFYDVSKIEIPVDELPGGVYILDLQGGGNIIKKMIIKR